MADWKSLTDGEWVNIVNSDAVKAEGSYVHGAVCAAFKLIEARLREKNEVASPPVAVQEEGDATNEAQLRKALHECLALIYSQVPDGERSRPALFAREVLAAIKGDQP